ncbi:MAG: hypothetical protein ACPGU7_08645 [Gammaproteobacteria bacterium]
MLRFIAAIYDIQGSLDRGVRAGRDADPGHPDLRRLTPAYRRKRSLTKNIWIGAGCIMMCNPVPPFIVIMSLLATLSSFVILDETP